MTASAALIGVIALIAAGYHGLITRFPNGGGDAKGLAAAFGEGWAFLPLGALHFTLTIAISCAAGASALIAYVPELAGLRVPLALAIVFGSFASFLGALLASTVLSRRERQPFATAIAAGGTLAVAVVLVLNLRRLDPILSLGTAAIVSVYLWRSWVAHAPPGGIPSVAT